MNIVVTFQDADQDRLLTMKHILRLHCDQMKAQGYFVDWDFETVDTEPPHQSGCICADCSGAELTARND